MNCPVCGGILEFRNNMYVCKNCRLRQSIATYFDQTDVYILYIENDEQGRRTKDSIIAKDIYNKLASKNINAFYKRITCEGLTGKDFSRRCEVAFNNAPIILILGTSKYNFKLLLSEYENKFYNKTLIPVYSGISAYDMPDELLKFQAMNYDKVGTIADLSQNIFHILGRKQKLNLPLVAEKNQKKNVLIISVTIILISMVIGCFYIIFSTPYILKSNKYDYAEKLCDKGNYIEAIKLYDDIGKYRDSTEKLKNIYNKYDGFYFAESSSLSLNLDIDQNLRAVIMVTKSDGKNKTSFDTSAVIEDNVIKFEFKDNKYNLGNGSITLTNSGVELIVVSDKSESFANWNEKYAFMFEDRTDAPINEVITRGMIFNWLSSEITMDELNDQGFKLEFLARDIIGETPAAEVYHIVNTDIDVCIYSEVLSTAAHNQVIAVNAPANILLPELIEKSTVPFIDDDYVYVPCAVASGNSSYLFEYHDSDRCNYIEPLTPVFIAPKKTYKTPWLDDQYEYWNWINDFVNQSNGQYGGIVNSIAIKLFKEYNCESDVELLTENENYYLFSYRNSELFRQNKQRLYRYDKKSKDIEFIKEIGYDLTGGSEMEYWYDDKNLVEEFPVRFSYERSCRWDY